MRGEIVLVRAFGGKPIKRRVWDVGVGIVYVTSDELFQKPVAGRRAPRTIGFPREDVFTDVQNQLLESGDTIDWSKLVPWQFPYCTQRNLIETEGGPKQYPLCFEVATWPEMSEPSAIQLPMFQGLARADWKQDRNPKQAFETKSRRRSNKSNTEIPTRGSTTQG